MIEPRPEERNHVGMGPVVRPVLLGDVPLHCLVRKKQRSLLWTADVDAARAAGLPSANKGDFLGWVDNSKITFLPVPA